MTYPPPFDLLGRLIWPIGIVAAPIALWFAARRAISLAREHPDVHASIRRAALVLGISLSACSAIATTVQLLNADITPRCLLAMAPWQPPAVYVWCTSMAVIFGLAVWVFAGTGARDLGALGGALSGVPPYSVRNVKLATLLYLILAPVLIVGSWYINPAANQCLAA